MRNVTRVREVGSGVLKGHGFQCDDLGQYACLYLCRRFDDRYARIITGFAEERLGDCRGDYLPVSACVPAGG